MLGVADDADDLDPGPGVDAEAPTQRPPGQYFLAIAWLTRPTLGPPSRSRSVMLRPSSSRHTHDLEVIRANHANAAPRISHARPVDGDPARAVAAGERQASCRGDLLDPG